jgi:hypothetical protein
VLGQFNRGFILASLGRDLFIVDQHASDERTRLEALSASTTLRRQPLLAPVPLALPVLDEMAARSPRAAARCRALPLAAPGLPPRLPPPSAAPDPGPPDVVGALIPNLPSPPFPFLSQTTPKTPSPKSKQARDHPEALARNGFDVVADPRTGGLALAGVPYTGELVMGARARALRGFCG